jgi:hypothetical protein
MRSLEVGTIMDRDSDNGLTGLGIELLRRKRCEMLLVALLLLGCNHSNHVQGLDQDIV